jgi:hypothetical protein
VLAGALAEFQCHKKYACRVCEIVLAGFNGEQVEMLAGMSEVLLTGFPQAPARCCGARQQVCRGTVRKAWSPTSSSSILTVALKLLADPNAFEVRIRIRARMIENRNCELPGGPLPLSEDRDRFRICLEPQMFTRDLDAGVAHFLRLCESEPSIPKHCSACIVNG